MSQLCLLTRAQYRFMHIKSAKLCESEFKNIYSSHLQPTAETTVWWRENRERIYTSSCPHCSFTACRSPRNVLFLGSSSFYFSHCAFSVSKKPSENSTTIVSKFLNEIFILHLSYLRRSPPSWNLVLSKDISPGEGLVHAEVNHRFTGIKQS